MIVTYTLSAKPEPVVATTWFRCGTPALNRALTRAEKVRYSESLRWSYEGLRAALATIAATSQRGSGSS